MLTVTKVVCVYADLILDKSQSVFDTAKVPPRTTAST